MSTERIQLLTKKYLDQQITEEEQQELARLIHAAGDDTLDEAMQQVWKDFPVDKQIPDHIKRASLQAILEGDTPSIHISGSVRRVRYQWAAAAAILILFAAGAWRWLQQREKPQQITETKVLHDALPGKNGAILTLGNGRKLVLDSLGNGVIATQGNTDVKLKDGQLRYDKNNEKPDDTLVTVTYNTMTTPKGRQYQLVLPDGTKVWLNAASSLTYPTVFTGNERKVDITGEAYFEVTKNALMPFKVRINDATEVEVLGTHFNVNAYTDEASISATLLEGSVRITSHHQEQTLRPGQQAQVKPDGSAVQLVKDADTAQVMAWKNGLFSFTRADLQTVMRQLARWYNVEVVYAGEPEKRAFTGAIDRGLTLNEVLKGLTKTRVNYTIEGGNKIIIQP